MRLNRYEPERLGPLAPGIRLIIAWIGTLCCVLALCGAAYAFASIRIASRTLAKAKPGATAFLPVTVFKPLHGGEPEMVENLRTFCAQDYPAPVQIIFGMESHDDAVLRTIGDLPCALNVRTDMVIDARQHGANRKISNLINMLPSARHDVLIISDSDIGVPPDWLRVVLGTLEQAGVGAVTCLYAGKPIANIWSKVMAMGVSYQFLPNVLIGTALGLAKPCFGSTIAFTRKTLEEIGGFAPLADVIQDDYALGDAIRARGLAVAIPPLVVTHTCAERTFGGWLAHELRWARTVRTIDPVGHFGSAATHTVPWAVLGVVLLGLSPLSITALAAALGSRLVLKSIMDRRLPAESGPLWLLPLRDLLSFLVFTASLFGTKIRWRGAQLEIRRHAALQS